MNSTKTLTMKRINSTIPRPTVAQRCASLTDAQLLAARAQLRDDTTGALVAVSAELARRGL